MYYLNEHQVGYHNMALGFPSIDGCRAICLLTKDGIFGIHVVGCNVFNDPYERMEKRAQAFSAFVNSHYHASNHVHLYSACFHQKRAWGPGGLADSWKNELIVYAKKLKYTGKVSSFDLSSVANWPITPGGTQPDSAYVEFRRNFDTVEMLYKPWGQCGKSPEINASTLAGYDYRYTDGAGNVTDLGTSKTYTSINAGGGAFSRVIDASWLTFDQKN